MSKKCFMLNYGGPGGLWWTSNVDKIIKLDKICQDCYGPPTRTEELYIKGVNIKVLTYGIHRGLYVELPEDPSLEARNIYTTLSNVTFNFCDKPYNLLGNNCVTSVATALHKLDQKITKEHIIFPWTLDAIVKKYQYLQSKDATLRQFFEIYQKKLNQETYLPFRKNRLKLQEIKSSKEIILNAHSKDKSKRERTKSSLIELNWVTEDKHGILHPTKKAPTDFIQGLNEFNNETRKVRVLEIIYNDEIRNLTSKTKKSLFNDKPDYETALLRIQSPKTKLPKDKLDNILNKMNIWQNQQDFESIIEKNYEHDLRPQNTGFYFDDDVLFPEKSDYLGKDEVVFTSDEDIYRFTDEDEDEDESPNNSI